MTKTLTEQWREEELPIDLYYVIDKLGRETIGNDCGIRDMMVDAFDGGNIFIKEVLAPVPRYDKVKEMSQKIERLEFDNEALEMAHNEGKEINAELVSKTEQLEKKLEIATKALKEINKNYRFTVAQDVVYKALKEMKGVK